MEQAYKAAVGKWGMSRSDFWSMHPVEFWWLVDFHTPIKMYGELNEDDVADLYEAI